MQTALKVQVRDTVTEMLEEMQITAGSEVTAGRLPSSGT